jgi:hypothetical protein
MSISASLQQLQTPRLAWEQQLQSWQVLEPLMQNRPPLLLSLCLPAWLTQEQLQGPLKGPKHVEPQQ